MVDVSAIRERYPALCDHLDERAKRIFAATEARTAGYGGIAAVSRATGIAASTIGRGLDQLETDELETAAPLTCEFPPACGGPFCMKISRVGGSAQFSKHFLHSVSAAPAGATRSG
jgi:hypothetical protein